MMLHQNNFHSSLSDSLTFYDGDSQTAAMIGKYCGSLIPFSFISASNKAFIRFQSNGNRANAGFKLEYHPFSKFIP